MEIGKRIIEIRKQHGLTQEEFAERYHVTRQTISNWENGKSSPDLETLVSMSEDFTVSLDAMLKGDKEMVRQISREQKHGRNFILKLAVVVLSIVLIAAGLCALGNTTRPLDPDDYDVVVNKIPGDDETLDEYEIVVTSDYKMSGWFIDSGENGALTLEVWRSNADFFNGRVYNRITCMWSGGFDKICDRNAYIEGNVDAATVWETGK